MQWSRKRHPHNSNMSWWFQLKRDQEYRDSQDLFPLDDAGDLVAVDLGWYDERARYHRGPRHEYVPYGKPVE